MARIDASTSARSFIIGLFLCLLAAVIAILPVPIFVRSIVLLFLAYLAVGFANIGFSYLIVLIVPVLGIFIDSSVWLILSPVIMSAGLLAMLSLEYTWRRLAVIASPFFWALVPLFVYFVSQHPLFELELPWNDGMTWWEQTPLVWILLHTIVAFAGSIIATIFGGKHNLETAETANQGQSQKRPTLY